MVLYSVIYSLVTLNLFTVADRHDDERFVEVLIRNVDHDAAVERLKSRIILFPKDFQSENVLFENRQVEQPARGGGRPLARVPSYNDKMPHDRHRRATVYSQSEIARRRSLRLQRKKQRIGWRKNKEQKNKNRDEEHSSYPQSSKYSTDALKQGLYYEGTNIQKPRSWTDSPGLTPWGEWSTCSATCHYGVQTRRRFCANTSSDSSHCQGKLTDTIPCGTGKACPTYSWNTWGEWTKCSRSCNSGMSYRSRRCVNDIPLYNGKRQTAPDHWCAIGLPYDSARCNTHECPRPRSAHFDNSNCGKVMARPQLRIAGGHKASVGDWPWQVSFQHRQCKKTFRPGQAYQRTCTWKHVCGASIVNKGWVITAAHCVAESGFFSDHNDPGDDWAVVIGMDKLNTGTSGDGVRHYLSKIVQHPDYVFTYITHSDVTLLKLKTDIEMSETVQPICMPAGQEPAPQEQCHITGWGYTSGKGEQLSRDLLHATIPMVPFSTCQRIGPWYRLLQEKVHMCGGDKYKGGTDSCGGDSGGPLTCQRQDGTYYLAGITSFGFSDCGKRGHVGIYSRMTSFEDWVRKTVSNDVTEYGADDYVSSESTYHNYDSFRSVGANKLA